MSINRIFSIISDNDVIATINVPDTSPNHEMLWAGLSSNPIIIESTNFPEVKVGWLYNGETFSNPESSL